MKRTLFTIRVTARGALIALAFLTLLGERGYREYEAREASAAWEAAYDELSADYWRERDMTKRWEPARAKYRR